MFIDVAPAPYKPRSNNDAWSDNIGCVHLTYKINKKIYSKYKQDKKKQCLKGDEILNYYTKRDTHNCKDILYIINLNRTVVPC